MSEPNNPKSIASRVCEHGQRIYDARLKSFLEASHFNEYVVIDVETGDYEVDRDPVAASDRAEAKRPGAVLYMTRVGWKAFARVGGRTVVREA